MEFMLFNLSNAIAKTESETTYSFGNPPKWETDNSELLLKLM